MLLTLTVYLRHNVRRIATRPTLTAYIGHDVGRIAMAPVPLPLDADPQTPRIAPAV